MRRSCERAPHGIPIGKCPNNRDPNKNCKVERQPEFAAYFARVIVWRARLWKLELLKPLKKEHPKYVVAFDKLTIEEKDE